jgi:hypothetical protein
VGEHDVDLDVLALHHGDDPFAEPFVGHAEHGAGGHARRRAEDPLDLGRVDVGAAPDDHQVLAVAHVQEAVVVEEPDVARVQDAALEGRRRGLGTVEVVEHRAILPGPLPLVGGPDADLAVDDLHAQVR